MISYHRDGSLPISKDWVFVFGSNEGGYHGAGAALVAKSMGRPIGSGFGFLQNNRGMTYGIPTKDMYIKSLDIKDVNLNIIQFCSFANRNTKMKFFITRVGCGLAGFNDVDIAKMFKDHLFLNDSESTISIPEKWRELLNEN